MFLIALNSGAPSPIFSSLPLAGTPLSGRQKRRDGPEDMPSTVKAERSDMVHSDGKKHKTDERRSAQSPIIASTPSIPPQKSLLPLSIAFPSPPTSPTPFALTANLDATRSPSKRKTPPAPPALRMASDDESHPTAAATASAKVLYFVITSMSVPYA